MSLSTTRQQGYKTLFAIAVIGVSVYLGFSPLFDLVPRGVPQAVISSSFGAIFVIILTMYLLNKQTEVEQESKRGERIFDEKVTLYNDILEKTKVMLADGAISQEEINRLPFLVMRLQMLGGDETIQAYIQIYAELNETYHDNDGELVEIPDEKKDLLYKLLIGFAGQCRKDIGISDKDIDESILNSAVKTVIQTGKKKRDTSKFFFKNAELAKNWYVLEVITDYVRNNPAITFSVFSKLFPRDLKGKSKTFEFWKTYDEALEHYAESGYTRYFISKTQNSDKRANRDIEGKDLVIKLADAEVCISNQWDISGVKNFIKHIKENDIPHE